MPSRPAPVEAPDARPRPRAVLYLRQSVAREESISLELQEQAGRDYCERNGYDVVAVEADPGISGRTWNRPAVQRVMAMVERKEADVVILWKWSRLSRNRLDWAIAVDKIETLGGRIESATEPVDTSTATGRFARGMLAEFAAFESERIGDVWREAHERRIRAGLPANGKPRFGYQYSREEGFTPDPVTGPILREMYQRYLRGESVYALTKWLNDGPTRPQRGYGVVSDGLWSARTIRRVLDSGFGAGYISHHGELLPGAHEGVITKEEFEAYQEARQRRAARPRAERSEYLLSGLVRCVCGSPMNPGMFGHNRQAKYRCKAAQSKRTHSGGYVTGAFVEAFVREWLGGLADRLNAAAAEFAASQALRPVADPEAPLRRKIAALDAKLDALTIQLVDGTIPRDSYERVRDRLSVEREALVGELRRISVRNAVPPVAVAGDLLATWDDLPIPARREALRLLIDYVEVTPGRPRATFRMVSPLEPTEAGE